MPDEGSGHLKIMMRDEIDWSVTTFEGAQLEQLRRWSNLSLWQVLTAQEEMYELANSLRESPQQSELTKNETAHEHLPTKNHP